MRPDLTTLKLFLAVVEEHSIAKAAEREHITAPAISKRITELETALNVQLFDRHAKGIRPTAAGEALTADVRSIFAILDRAENKLSEYASGHRGRILIHANPSGVSGALPIALREYLDAHPLIGIQLEEKHSIDVVRAVTEGEADIGIFAPHVPAEGLTIRPYQQIRLMLITPLDHALAKRKTISLAEAAAHDFVSLSDASSIGNLVLRVAAQQGVALRHRLQVDGFDGLRRMVQAGLGVAVMPEHCALPYSKAMSFHCIPLTDSWARYRLNICTRDPKTLSMAARLLLAHLKSGVSPRKEAC
jgi:DNA-binding transcriptional LysR family regulator